MNCNRTEIGSVHPLYSPAVRRRQQLTRRRTPLALALIAAALTVTAGAAELSLTLFRHIELHSAVVPLAPAPAPPVAPAPVSEQKPHSLRRFAMHPLAGFASWYGTVWNGRKTASGETFDESQLTAAHPTLPLGTLVRVTNLSSMRSVIVRINDRGAFAPSRIIDLSFAAAREIGMAEQGLARVKLEILGRK